LETVRLENVKKIRNFRLKAKHVRFLIKNKNVLTKHRIISLMHVD